MRVIAGVKPEGEMDSRLTVVWLLVGIASRSSLTECDIERVVGRGLL